jgi:hypothetical protein
MVNSTIWDNGNFYPAGSIVNQGDSYYQAITNVPDGTAIDNTTYWRPYTPPTQETEMTTRPKDQAINDAILTQADVEVPLSGYDTQTLYVLPATVDNQPANPNGLTADGTYSTVDGTEGGANLSPENDGYTVGYLTGDGIPPNGFPTSAGTSFPSNPVVGDFSLRLDYFPNRLFRYNGTRWLRIEDNVRTNLNNGSSNNTLRSGFVNNTYTVPTKDMGNIPSRQSLSEILKPRADNGDQNGNKPANGFPDTQPNQRSS